MTTRRHPELDLHRTEMHADSAGSYLAAPESAIPPPLLHHARGHDRRIREAMPISDGGMDCFSTWARLSGVAVVIFDLGGLAASSGHRVRAPSRMGQRVLPMVIENDLCAAQDFEFRC
jgi:hypothetical protein